MALKPGIEGRRIIQLIDEMGNNNISGRGTAGAKIQSGKFTALSFVSGTIRKEAGKSSGVLHLPSLVILHDTFNKY